jgi:glycosyltransferase involved in cell wall biosynthesis
MKILHLYSDWKWTGPAEPVLQMCRSLEDAGHDVLCAFRAPQMELDETIADKAREIGIRCTTQFELDRYLNPIHTVRDLVGITRSLRREAYDIVHLHLSHDHAFGGICGRLAGAARPLLVRTLHRRSVLADNVQNRFLLRRLTDGCLAFTPQFRQRHVDTFGLAPETVGVQPMTVDLTRFYPEAPARDMRPEFGLAPGTPLIGIVGRFQKYRRADVFLEAAAAVLRERPDVRFLVIGRSSQFQETVVKPMQALGIEDKVVCTGYRIDDYVDVMKSLDIFSLLMPGFDGTARAVREALALGVPCVVSDYGMLPEIVADGETGAVVPSEPKALAAAWLKLLTDDALRQQAGERAAACAREAFDIAAVGPALEAYYHGLLAHYGRQPRG